MKPKFLDNKKDKVEKKKDKNQEEKNSLSSNKMSKLAIIKKKNNYLKG